MRESFEHLTITTHRSENRVPVTDTAQILERLSARAIQLARLATSCHLVQAAHQPHSISDQPDAGIESNAFPEAGP